MSRDAGAAAGFGDRFDREKTKKELKNNVAQIVEKNEINRDILAFIRNRQRQQSEVFSKQQSGFFMDEDDQYDIPAFLRKSLD